MPRGIVHEEYVPRALESDALIGVVHEDLEDLLSAVADFKCVAFTLTRHDHATDVHSQMGPGVRRTDFLSLHGKPSLWVAITFDITRVEKREIRFELQEKCPDNFNKLFSPLFILAQRPRTKHFESKPCTFTLRHQRTVPCLQFVFVGELYVELATDPVAFMNCLSSSNTKESTPPIMLLNNTS